MKILTKTELNRNLLTAQQELYSSKEFIDASDEEKLIYIRVLGAVLKALDKTSDEAHYNKEVKLSPEQMDTVKSVIITSCRTLQDTLYAREDVVKEFLNVVFERLDEKVAEKPEEMYNVVDGVLTEAEAGC